MQKALGLLMILGGIALGLYLGLYWAFVGGIIQIIEEVRAEEIDASVVAWGVVKIVCSNFIGVFSGIVLILPGRKLWKLRA